VLVEEITVKLLKKRIPLEKVLELVDKSPGKIAEELPNLVQNK